MTRLLTSTVFIMILSVIGVRYAQETLIVDAAQPSPKQSSYTSTDYGTVTLFADSRGHFFVDVAVNGTYINFMVDTGASLVALTELDAQRAGINLNELDYRHRAHTANGVVSVAVVKLDEIEIDDIVLRNVDAAIHKGAGLDQSLLGMAALSRLSQFNVDGNRLVLRQ